MIEEDYVSFEVAKQLKSIGYKYPCRGRYDEYGNIYISIHPINYDNESKQNSYFLMPTLYKAFKFLRDVYKVNINIKFIQDSIYSNQKPHNYYNYDIILNNGNNISNVYRYSSYENCLNAALSSAISNLIK